MQKFLGAFERHLDDKGRLALPSTYRARLGTPCYLTLGSDNSIEVFTAEKFEQEADHMEELLQIGEIDLNKVRVFSARAQAVEPDGQGRIYLDARLRDHAGIASKTPVMILGRLDRLEICSIERYRRRMMAGEQLYSEDPS